MAEAPGADRMTTDDHATHRLSARIRALYGTEPSKGLIDALAFEAENLQRRLDEARARLAEDDGMAAETRVQVRAPVREVPPSSGDSKVFMHG